jgi:hypothetical protein
MIEEGHCKVLKGDKLINRGTDKLFGSEDS